MIMIKVMTITSDDENDDVSTRDHANNQMELVPFDSDLTKLEPWASDTMSRTDLPRLRAGKVLRTVGIMMMIRMITIMLLN